MDKLEKAVAVAGLVALVIGPWWLFTMVLAVDVVLWCLED